MKTNGLLLLLISLFILKPGFAQDCPPNIDFEKGDFSSWDCFIGATTTSVGKNVITLTPSPPTANRHQLISAANNALDKYGKFPMLCPYGGNYSVKLGNENVGAQAEGISYTFTIPTTIDTFTFTYFYAVVLENPNHLTEEQPRFFVTAYEVGTNNIVNCASYDYVSKGALPGFLVSSTNASVLYKNWTPISLRFAGLKGKTVRLEFKTADCTRTGHFGYAYLDVASGCSDILATAPYCIETNSLVLNAPYGYKTYTWYNEDYSKVLGTQQSVTLTPPPAKDGLLHVDVTPYPGFGCSDTFHAKILPLSIPDTPVAISQYSICQYSMAPPLIAIALPGNDLIWYTSATGGIGNSTVPIPSTLVTGIFTYYVSQKVLFGCESFRKKITLTVIQIPIAGFKINTASSQCQRNNLFTFTSTSTNLSDAVFTWNFADGKSISSATDSIVSNSYTDAGYYTVNLKVVNEGGCAASSQYRVTVIPKPVATFAYPSIICEMQTIVKMADKSFVPTVTAIINKWWWNVDGTILQIQNPASFIPAKPGIVSVLQVVTSSEGCISDTNKIEMAVHYRPPAAFGISNPLCDNELILFTNLSTMPTASSPETIIKWDWQFSNAVSSSLSNPTVMFTAGTRQAKLVTETGFGCRSLEKDSVFEIHAKPRISLYISDSCVFRSIRFNAVDITNAVDKWFWDFGNGLYNGNSQLTKSFRVAINLPVTLLAQSVFDCKDTVVRPFAIYDNIAFAGRDTVVAVDEPVQLNAMGYPATKYLWSPSNGLNSDTIVNPIALLNTHQLYNLDAYTKEGCDAHSKILIKRYKGPELYIPTAFTPNGDRNNDVLRVFPVGIKSFNYFAVYDRFGNMVFRTIDYAYGWDGTLNGNPVAPGAFVAVAFAIDYKGKVLKNKVNVMLIR